MDFNLDRLLEYSDEALIEEIRRVAALCPENILTKSFFKQHGRVGLTTLRRRFGQWLDVLKIAGLEHKYSGQPISKAMVRQLSRDLSNEEILNELKRVARLLNQKHLTTTDIQEHSHIGPDVIRSRFGSWKNGLMQCGLSSSKYGERYKDEECFENLLNVWTALGRRPLYREMYSPPSIVGGKVYAVRWGTWMKACKAFIEWTNRDSVANVTQPKSSSSKEKLGSERPVRRREVSLGTRFRVLQRDNFKCVLCGESPATTLGCKLHVDHIVPFSKGGSCTENNLRTLCKDCNIGRGNRFSQ